MSFEKLPLEITINIFYRLDYCTLKTCERVSRGFKGLVNNKMLAAHNFRGSLLPEGAVENPDKVELHPIFNSIDYYCSDHIDHVLLHIYSDEPGNFRHWLLKDVGAAKDFATNPAVTKIVTKVHHFPPVETKNKHGVTVLQVMQAVCRIFKKKLPKRLEPYIDDYDFCSYRDFMGDHTVWNGFDDQSVDGQGRLVLKAYLFDS